MIGPARVSARGCPPPKERPGGAVEPCGLPDPPGQPFLRPAVRGRRDTGRRPGLCTVARRWALFRFHYSSLYGKPTAGESRAAGPAVGEPGGGTRGGAIVSHSFTN